VQEISAASREQNTGTDEINRALQQLDRVVQQSAASSEEMAATSEQLTIQTEQLRKSMDFFNLNSATPIAARETQQQRESHREVSSLSRLHTKTDNKSLQQGHEGTKRLRQEDHMKIDLDMGDEAKFASY